MRDVSFGSEADIETRPPDVRFASDSGQGGLCGPRSMWVGHADVSEGPQADKQCDFRKNT